MRPNEATLAPAPDEGEAAPAEGLVAVEPVESASAFSPAFPEEEGSEAAEPPVEPEAEPDEGEAEASAPPAEGEEPPAEAPSAPPAAAAFWSPESASAEQSEPPSPTVTAAEYFTVPEPSLTWTVMDWPAGTSATFQVSWLASVRGKVLKALPLGLPPSMTET